MLCLSRLSVGQNIEVRYAGQMGRLGRYSIHFHMIGAVRNSYVRANSIHHTFNRAIAIHGVHYLRCQDNVAFETRGHTYFVEDGLETKNVITGNLGANTRELFVGLTSDATPSTYWLVNGDNYVERNIAAGSTHYGFWFFPEPKVRGASEFEPGSSGICPQGTPLWHFADNEAHNNGRYGLRIFTGRSSINGDGLPGFYPKSALPCAPVSADNPFKIARFIRQYSWRNGKNGITVGSVAAVQIVDAIVADNNMRGIEMTGADGIQPGLSSMTALRGPWGMNKLIGILFIAHPLPCPACDHTFQPHIPQHEGIPGQGWGQSRLGLVCAAWLGLTVENATFINCAMPSVLNPELYRPRLCLLTPVHVVLMHCADDRPGMIAVGGFAKAFPPQPNGYDFVNTGGMETRFFGTTWLASNHRVRWRWDDEARFVDLDGTFADQPFCAGCTVLRNNLIRDKRAFPDCYLDSRYGGSVCKPTYKFVEIGILPSDPLMLISTMRVSHRNTEGDGSGLYVRADDAEYLRNKWRPDGEHNLVELDVSTDTLIATVVGEGDTDWTTGSWSSARGRWVGRHTAEFVFRYVDRMGGDDEYPRELPGGSPDPKWRQGSERTLIAEISSDGSSLTWVNGTDLFYGSHQLYSHKTWWRCEMVPERCTDGDVRYPDFASQHPGKLILANTQQFTAAMQYHTQVPMGRRYQVDMILPTGLAHSEVMDMSIAESMRSGDWLEVATNSFSAFPKTGGSPGIRPVNTLPRYFGLGHEMVHPLARPEADRNVWTTQEIDEDGGVNKVPREWSSFDGTAALATRPWQQSDETFGGRRRMTLGHSRRQLMTAAITYEPRTTQAVFRFEGAPNCLTDHWWDPCIGQFFTPSTLPFPCADLLMSRARYNGELWHRF